ncbi:hypothetical protein FN846DRAFT_964315 [Sphaerosporella brunnea]|uniref:Phosphoglucomutase n=1 Tax=Sphaerosporella brunnea TaxID=1250544 RepID=A0A5J5EM81_9PEZI|nr:hypothetical protein FN846DRAFT_964315 [Sphaerosporella brunnea]
MQAGFARMNDLTVIQASQGLAEYIVSSWPSRSTPSVVIGHDHRHNSRRFARLAAAAMIQRGIKVYYYTALVHTPLVPFGVSMLQASAGIMITASHNPAQDNGYKVYWCNGCQIIPPHDKNIAAAIERNLEPKCWDENLVDNAPEGMVETPLNAVKDAYFTCLKNMNAESMAQRLRFVYTPMHGVGLSAMLRATEDLGVDQDMLVVPAQAQPNPEFPTVRFPNPEERGALDLAISVATANGLTLVLASDPDADRFAAAQRLPCGEWRTFTGNELGILFAAQALDAYRQKHPDIDKLNRLCMLCSTVSSQMLRSMADAESFRFEETLTGFKWLGSRALQLRIEQGFDAVYAFEEAIGYMFVPVVYDKDGIAAASVFITMAREWAQQGLTPYDKLQELYKKYGYFQSANSYFISKDPALTRKVFADIRALGSPYPQSLGGRKITRWRDLTEGYDSATPDNKPTLPVSKSSEMITVEMEGGVRFTVRGSGTEPKIKMYIECKADTEETAREGAEQVAADLTREWFRPAETGLLLP